MKKQLNKIATKLYLQVKAKGFHCDNRASERELLAVDLMNLSSEISELWESFRTGVLKSLCDKSNQMEVMGLKPLTNLEEEMADIVIRALTISKAMNIDIGEAVKVKSAYNKTRAHRHGGKLA